MSVCTWLDIICWPWTMINFHLFVDPWLSKQTHNMVGVTWMTSDGESQILELSFEFITTPSVIYVVKVLKPKITIKTTMLWKLLILASPWCLYRPYMCIAGPLSATDRDPISSNGTKVRVAYQVTQTHSTPTSLYFSS